MKIIRLGMLINTGGLKIDNETGGLVNSTVMCEK